MASPVLVETVESMVTTYKGERAAEICKSRSEFNSSSQRGVDTHKAPEREVQAVRMDGSLPTAHCSLLTAHGSLFTTRWPLLTTHR